MTRLLITGRNGQVGHELELILARRFDVRALGSSSLDISDEQALRSAIREYRPDVMVNAAAYTAVDNAESEQDAAFAVNATAPGIMAEEMARLGGALIHYSTDFVFDGEQRQPYCETDATAPLNVYGVSKREGERSIAGSGCPHVILRTGWVYGSRGSNFPRTIGRLLKAKDVLNVVDDQIGSPTWSRDIALATNSLLDEAAGASLSRFRDISGIYHFTSEGQTTWFGFARRVAKRLQADGVEVARLNSIPSAQFPTAARRPSYSVLDCRKARLELELRPRAWEEAFDECFRSILPD